MPNFDKVILDGQTLNVKDSATAATVNKLSSDILALQQKDSQLSADINTLQQKDSSIDQDIANLQRLVASTADNAWNNNNTAINAVLAGMPSNGDISKFLNDLQTSNPNKAIIIPYGNYTAKNTINITAPQFFFYGNLSSTANIAFQSNTSGQRVYIRYIAGESSTSGVGLKVSGKQNGTGRSIYCVDYVTNMNTAILLEDSENGGGGVLRNQFMFNYFDHVSYGIVISATTTGSFVNQNYFLGGGIEASGCAIETRGSQSDPFNGNIFVNISFEGSSKAIHLHNAKRNVFRDFRLYENTQQDTITIDSGSGDNYFYGGCSEIFNINEISDNDVNYYYNMLLHDNGKVYSSSLRSGGQTIITTLDQYRRNTALGAENPNVFSQFYSVIMDNNDISVPAWFIIDGAQHPFILYVKKANNNRLMTFSGSVIANSNDGTGSAGLKLTAETYYLVVSPTFMIQL